MTQLDLPFTRDLHEYQRQVRSGILTKPGTDLLSHAALGLTGEAGEVADIVKKSQYAGRELDVVHMAEELGDTLWYLTYLAGELGLSLYDLAEQNLTKLNKRHPQHYNPASL